MTHYLEQYAKFSTKEEMDAAARWHMDAHWNAMSNTDRKVLEMIRCYSVKYGAAHLKHETIETSLKKSNSTVRRALRKLIALKIIERIHFIRPVMSGLGANIYVLLPVDEHRETDSRDELNETRSEAVSEHISENEPSLFQSTIHKDLIKTSPDGNVPLSNSLFSKMKRLLAGTIGSSANARVFYGIHLSYSGKLLKYEIHRDKKELFEELAYRALHISVLAAKTKSIRSLPGYFKGVLRELVLENVFGDVFMEYTVPVEGIIGEDV